MPLSLDILQLKFILEKTIVQKNVGKNSMDLVKKLFGLLITPLIIKILYLHS